VKYSIKCKKNFYNAFVLYIPDNLTFSALLIFQQRISFWMQVYEGLFVKIKNSAFYDIFGAKYAYLANWHAKMHFYLNSQIRTRQNAYLAK